MAYSVACDSCQFTHTVDDELDAYELAKNHESDHTTHFVHIVTAE